jgi:hypothetical protein
LSGLAFATDELRDGHLAETNVSQRVADTSEIAVTILTLGGFTPLFPVWLIP